MTRFPQFVLGLTFSWGVLLGWTAVTASLPTCSTIWIYAGCVAWVFGYDTIYAIQDMEDDRIVGIKSSALAFGNKIKHGTATAYAIAIVLIATGLFVRGHNELQPVIMGWAGLGGMATVSYTHLRAHET